MAKIQFKKSLGGELFVSYTDMETKKTSGFSMSKMTEEDWVKILDENPILHKLVTGGFKEISNG